MSATWATEMGLTPQDVADALEQLVTLGEQATGTLGGSPTNDALYAEMLALLTPAHSFGVDFSGVCQC